MLIRRRCIPIGLSIVLLVTAGCSASKDTAVSVSVTAEQRQVAQLRALPFGELNIAVDLAASAVQGLLRQFAKPVVDLVTDAFGVVALIQQFSSFLDKWRASLSLHPSHTRFGVDSEAVTGQVELAVAQKTLQVPDAIADCAKAFQVDLRDAASAAGSRITWSDKSTGPVQPLATRTSADAALAQDKTARYRYQTAQESSELAKSPDTETYAYRVRSVIHRNDVEKALELFKHLGLGQLPTEVRGIAEALTNDLLAQPRQHLTQLTDVTVSDPPVYITYHVRRMTPSPSKPDIGAGTGKKATLPGTGQCAGAAVASFGYREPEMQLTGDGWVCFYIRNPGEYQLVIRVLNYPLTAPVVPDAEPVAIPGATVAWIDDNCTSQTGPCYSMDVVVGDQTLQISGAVSRDKAIAIVESILGVAWHPRNPLLPCGGRQRLGA